MEENCINCGKHFEKKNKGYKRKSVDSNTKFPAVSVRKILETSLGSPVTPTKNLYICDSCASLCVKIYGLKDSTKKTFDEFERSKCDRSYLGKRKQSFSTPSKTVESISPFSPPLFASPVRKRVSILQSPVKKVTSKGFIDRAVANLKDSKYLTCFNILLKKSKAAREALAKVIRQTISNEIKHAKKKDSFLSKKLSLCSLEEFSWMPAIKEIEARLPIFTSAVKGAFTTPRNNNKISFNDNDKAGKLVPAYGFALSSILHHRMPSQIRFLQEILSVEMYRSGCNQKLFQWFNKLGLCRSVTSTRLCEDYDIKIKEWKTNIQHELGNYNLDRNDNVDESLNTDNSIYSMEERYDADESEEKDDDDDDDAEDDDNADDDDDDDDDDTDGDDDHDDDADDDLEGIVPLLESSILDDNVHDVNDDDELDPGYSLCWDNVQKLCSSRHQSADNPNKMMLWALCFATRNRIPFRYLDYDTDTIPATNISLQKYLPETDDWAILRERMEIITQRILKKNFPALNEADVEMHIPHKYSAESMLKSEIVNLGVLKENPSTCKGVIEIMKYLHQNYVPVTPNGIPYKIICHGDQLSIERMVDGKLAMAGSEQLQDRLAGLVPRPQGFHKRCIVLQDSMNEFYNGKSAAEKGTLFQIKNKFGHRNVKLKVSDCVNSCVDFWNFVTEGYVCLLACKLMNISSTDQCPEELITQNVDDYVLSMSREIVKKIWPFVQTTSDDLNQTTSYIDECADDTFAYEEQFESTIQSSDDEQSEVLDTEDEDDHKYQYSCAVAWNGLKMMAERDAERENDGLAILSHWRIDMIQFFNNNHNKYLILGHRLLSAVNGWLPSRLIEDLIWNSTANLTGQPGNNLALDLVNEFLNNEFKTNLKNSHGQYSDSQISRCSKIAGSLGKGIEEVFQTAIMDKYVHKSKSNSYNNSKGIAKFVNTYLKEDLFQKIKHRRHTGYENFKHIINVKNMNALHKRFIKYSIELDKETFVCES